MPASGIRPSSAQLWPLMTQPWPASWRSTLASMSSPTRGGSAPDGGGAPAERGSTRVLTGSRADGSMWPRADAADLCGGATRLRSTSGAGLSGVSRGGRPAGGRMPRARSSEKLFAGLSSRPLRRAPRRRLGDRLALDDDELARRFDRLRRRLRDDDRLDARRARRRRRDRSSESDPDESLRGAFFFFDGGASLSVPRS